MTSVHKDIKVFLQEQGLTTTEVSLYVTGLQFGPQTTAELAKRSGVKRTTAQSALTALVEKGMFAVHTQSGAQVYVATDPNLLERQFTERIDDLKVQQLEFINLLPLFEDLTSQSSAATAVANYQGLDGVKTAVDAALFCASRRWKIIAPDQNFFSEGDSEYADYFIRTRKQRSIKAQSLWEPNFIAGRKFDETALAFRNPRVLSKKLAGKFKNTIIIFDTSVVFVSSVRELSAVLIKSVEISQTMEVFFDGLWQASSPLPKRKMDV